jgi:hypothetical protein
MNIEAGDYIRTRGGHFHKIIRIDNNGLFYWKHENGSEIACGYSLEQIEGIITKHSKNIIDLLQVGDFVNKKQLIDIVHDTDRHSVRTDFNNLIYEELINKDIKSIVTKEQYKNAEYIVKEQNRCNLL